jgi:hypothetical protein
VFPVTVWAKKFKRSAVLRWDRAAQISFEHNDNENEDTNQLRHSWFFFFFMSLLGRKSGKGEELGVKGAG